MLDCLRRDMNVKQFVTLTAAGGRDCPGEQGWMPSIGASYMPNVSAVLLEPAEPPWAALMILFSELEKLGPGCLQTSLTTYAQYKDCTVQISLIERRSAASWKAQVLLLAM